MSCTIADEWKRHIHVHGQPECHGNVVDRLDSEQDTGTEYEQLAEWIMRLADASGQSPQKYRQKQQKNNGGSPTVGVND